MYCISDRPQKEQMKTSFFFLLNLHPFFLCVLFGLNFFMFPIPPLFLFRCIFFFFLGGLGIGAEIMNMLIWVCFLGDGVIMVRVAEATVGLLHSLQD